MLREQSSLLEPTPKLDLKYEENVEAIGEHYLIEPGNNKTLFLAPFDVGLLRTTTGNRVFGALKVDLDDDVDIFHNEKRSVGFIKDNKQLDIVVDQRYIYGDHVAAYMKDNWLIKKPYDVSNSAFIRSGRI